MVVNDDSSISCLSTTSVGEIVGVFFVLLNIRVELSIIGSRYFKGTYFTHSRDIEIRI